MDKVYSTYVFDLDGTLLNTLGDLTCSCNYALRANGMPEHTIEDVRHFVGNGVKKLMERAVPNGLDNPLFEKTFDDFRKHYLLHGQDTTKPYPDVIEVLQQLHDKGKHIAVVSNKFYEATRELCSFYFGTLVEVAIGEREDIKRKPAPDTVIEAFKQLSEKCGQCIDKTDAVYVGDSDVDIATAKNAGLPCISVLWGFRSKEFLLQHGATTFISSMKELL